MNPAVNKPAAERNPNDYYPTPQPLADAICLRLRELIGPVGLIVEPSAGEGAFVRAAHAAWPDACLRAYEPHREGIPEGCWWPGATWHARTWEDADDLPVARSTLILGNPPFLLWESHARLGLERLADGDHLAFLLRASALGSQRRVRGLWREHPPAHVWHVAPRPSFTGDGRTDGAEYAVVVWCKGHRGDYAGGWLTWQRETLRRAG